MKATPTETKAQAWAITQLEKKGYDYSHTTNGLPYYVLRSKKTYVAVKRDGHILPA